MIAKLIAQQKAMVSNMLMPDTVTLTARAGDNQTVNDYGVITQDAPIPRTGVTCRIDYASSYRPDGLTTQPMDVTEYSIQFPTDTTIAETDIVTIGTEEYEIQKLSSSGTWEHTIIAQVMRLTT